MKKFVILTVSMILLLVNLHVAGQSFIVNNNTGAGTAEDSLTISFILKDSVGSMIGGADSFFVLVTNSKGTVTFTGSYNLSSPISSSTVGGYTFYIWTAQVSDIDGNGLIGPYAGVVLAVDTGLDLVSSTNFGFNLEPTFTGAKFNLEQLAIRASGNDTALIAKGSGSGQGMLVFGGTTGHGVEFRGGATSGDAIATWTSDGNGMSLYGSKDKHGLIAQSGDSGCGIYAMGGDDANAAANAYGFYARGRVDDGIQATAGSGNNKHGIEIRGGTGDGGDAVRIVATSANADGVYVTTTDGHGYYIVPTGGNGFQIEGDTAINANGTLMDVSGVVSEQKFDSLMIALGYRVGAKSYTDYAALEDTVSVGNSSAVWFRIIYMHPGGIAGDPPDSTKTVAP